MNKKRKDQRGGMAIFAVLMLPIFLALTCLTIDLMNLFVIREKMQSAADAAALAAVTSINTVSPGNVSKATSQAQTISQSNAFTNGINTISVKVSIPPGDPYNKSATYANNSNFARVQISQSVPLYFGGVVGIPKMTVSADAVAGPTSSSVSLMTLAPSGSGSLALTGSGSISSADGTIDVNSQSSSALTLTGSGTITSKNINIVGGYSLTGSGSFHGTINTGVSASADPFAAITLPTSPYLCNYTNYSITGSKAVTVSPGIYCGGISITGSGTITFSPGTYILNGGGLAIAGSSIITGNGVTFYNTGTKGSYSYGPISITGSSTLTLSAPTSGPYAGMLFIQDPLNTNSATIRGSSSDSLAGNLYFPRSFSQHYRQWFDATGCRDHSRTKYFSDRKRQHHILYAIQRIHWTNCPL